MNGKNRNNQSHFGTMSQLKGECFKINDIDHILSIDWSKMVTITDRLRKWFSIATVQLP